MRKYFGLCCLIIFGTGLSETLFAQKSQLQKVDAAFKEEQVAAGIRIESYLKRKNKTGRISYRKDGLMLLLVDVSASGIPIYIKADNAGVATSLNVNELRSTGALGLNLEGDGIEIGIWDEGKIRNDHVELTGRVTQIDNASTLSTHATHVLGTIMATGLNANAKGMAPQATAIAFDFSNDVSEMTGQAAPDQSSIVLSNHSYGTLSGWDFDGSSSTWHGDPSISNVADWKFGFYNSTSKLYDDIAFSAPYYLIVKAAGNDGNDIGIGPQEPDCNPFDCIPTNGVAKNIMTVGAAGKLTGPYTGPGDVVIASFSSKGPTDDGRIKPDIVAPGLAVTSTSSSTTNSYTILSGTSMASPATTGTLVLLQELHKNLNAGNLMKAATLKALAIHTAREAGANNGPDYTHGWGLLDAEAAAKILVDKDDQNIFVEELSINNSEVYELALSPVQNTKITATIVWTDPAGTPQSPSLNPTTKMLVNDLDLRLVDDGGTQQFPWILNPANPSVAAVKADNFRDNVEKIEFENPEPRNYKLRVTHKGTLVNGKQDFSLIINYTSLIDPRVSYYWIGNTGDWNDGTKWSLTSGGASANLVPGVDDKIVFDENSFSADNQIVSLTQNHECYSLRWFANELIDLSFGGNTLTVKEGINLLSDNITSSSTGTMSFEGDATINAIINLGNNNLDDLSVVFSGTGATWNVMGNVSLNRIELIEGAVSIGANSVKANEIIASGTQTKSVNLIDTDLTPINSLLVNLGSASLQTENFTINIPSTVSPNSLDFGSMPFEGTINLQGGEVDILGDGEIEKIEGQGIVKIFGSHSIAGFELGAGSVLQLEQGSTQVFTENFLLGGISGNAIAINSSGPAPAIISFDGHYKICLDHLLVDNVNVEGESTVNAGLNSTVANATNWIQKACGEILFPDFLAENTCVNASVLFQDNSSGSIVSRSWNFGDNGSSNNISNLEDPIHFYAQKDEYMVTLIVSDGVDTESYTKTIQLQDNALTENTAELNNGKLISFLPSNQYQWILDNELIAGATSRTINFSGDLGEYAVLTFDSFCNRKSAPFVITGIEESILNSNRSVVYPNPTQGRVYVGSPDGSPIVSLQIINGLGQVLSSKMNSTEDELAFDLGGYRAGIYILRIQTERTTYIERVVVR